MADHAGQVAIELRSSLSQDAQVLTEVSAPEFRDSLKRWSDIDIHIPSAILIAGREDDIVSQAIARNIPFVARSGGNSFWSTLPSPGWIIDFSLLTTTTINSDSVSPTATIQAGVLTKPLNEAVAAAGYMVQTATGSQVGYIPFLLGGGNSALVGMYGMASDSLVSARVVTATKGLVTASPEENEALFYALKGAGQFYGVVTEVTVKIFPLVEEIWSWTCIFLPHQIEDVAKVLKEMVDEVEPESGGMAAVTLPPGPRGNTKPIILVSLTHFRSEFEAARVMQPLLAIKPINQIKKLIPFGNLTDAGEALMVKGGLKSIHSCGLQTFDAEKFVRCLDAWNGLTVEHPGAGRSFFMFNWFSTEGCGKFAQESSAWSHRDIKLFYMLWTVAEDETSSNAARRAAEDFLTLCQEDQSEGEKALFPNHTRSKSLEQRYRGEKRREKLGALKRVWDPQGVFTRQFLD